jgi:hypothetical protein
MKMIGTHVTIQPSIWYHAIASMLIGDGVCPAVCV